VWNPGRFRPRNHFQFFETQRVFRHHWRTVDACPRAEAADHRTYANRFGRAIATRVASRVAASRLTENLEFATPSISNAFTQLLHSLLSRQNFGPAYSLYPRCRTSRVWKNTGPQLAGARVTSQG